VNRLGWKNAHKCAFETDDTYGPRVLRELKREVLWSTWGQSVGRRSVHTDRCLSQTCQVYHIHNRTVSQPDLSSRPTARSRTVSQLDFRTVSQLDFRTVSQLNFRTVS
jgi:hypothetical protein